MTATYSKPPHICSLSVAVSNTQPPWISKIFEKKSKSLKQFKKSKKITEGRYGYGTLAHQNLEPNSTYFGSYKKDKWSLYFSSTFSELLRLNSHNFRIWTPNQKFFISTDIYRKSYTRYSHNFVGNAHSKIIKFSL